MKKLVVFLSVVGAGVIYLSAVGSGKPKAVETSLSVPMAHGNKGAIAIVHSSRLGAEYYRVQELRNDLTKMVDAVKKELTSMGSDYEKAKEKHDELLKKSENPALTEDAKKKLRAEADDKLATLQQKEHAIRDFGMKSQSRINELESGESAKIMMTIKQKVGEIAEEGKISIVLDADHGGVVYANETLDWTDSVLALLNATQPKQVATAPAVAP